jgi:hypothetical protein
MLKLRRKITMTKMKKHVALIALASALGLGAVTTSFAQEPQQNGTSGSYNQYAPSDNGSSQYAPSYGNTGAGSGPGDY